MEMHLRMSLPSDERTIPMARHLFSYALSELGVVEECKADVELALTEACTNVLDHASGESAYDVEITVDTRACIIRVVDGGTGFDPENAPQAGGDHNAESGRGLELMRALVDRVKFVSKPDEGTVVHLEKDLEFAPDAPAKILAP